MAGNLPALKKYLDNNGASPVVEFDRATDKLFPFNFTASNTELYPDLFENTDRFSEWVTGKLQSHNCRYGIGGYNEHRTIYSRSGLFDTGAEPRRLHLGTDIWGPAGTRIFSPLDATVHSYNFNNNFGDYGATIILQHDLDGLTLHTLYGHLGLASLSGLAEGRSIGRGQPFAAFGIAAENGHWPPHLHFQLIFDMKGHTGDYPGVCAFSERDKWLANSLDPALILQDTFGSLSPA